jgi:hypothetical protein
MQIKLNQGLKPIVDFPRCSPARPERRYPTI